MYNNVSYRRYDVTGTASPFNFSPTGATQRIKRAVEGWTGATVVPIHPSPGQDGTGLVAYKVTNPSAGVWHYEYAVYNESMDRAIQTFSVPADATGTLSNIGFRAPPQHPGSANDGTAGSAGFSSRPWPATQNGSMVTWNTETLAQNPNANAIRWGTMYNFRFDSNSPPQAATATVGFFKNGAPINVPVMAPVALAATPTPTPTSTPTSTPTATPTASPTPPSTAEVGGGVVLSDGRGLRATVVLTEANGIRRTITTNSFGFYTFSDVPRNQMITIVVRASRYRFAAQQMMVMGNMSNVNFTALE